MAKGVCQSQHLCYLTAMGLFIQRENLKTQFPLEFEAPQKRTSKEGRFTPADTLNEPSIQKRSWQGISGGKPSLLVLF
jgi:hypothetical protein